MMGVLNLAGMSFGEGVRDRINDRLNMENLLGDPPRFLNGICIQTIKTTSSRLLY